MEAVKAEKMTVQFEKDDSLQFIYVDSASIMASYYDFKFIFGNSFKESTTVNVKEVNKIVMSPQHAKAMLVFLQKQVEEYEDKFGKINLPKDILQGATEA